MPKPPKSDSPNIRIERIKELMKEQNISNIVLAKNVGVDKTAVSRWLNYKNDPTPDNLKRIADALNTTTDYLNGYRGAYKSKTAQERADKEYALMFGEELDVFDSDEESRTRNRKRRRTIRNGFFLREIGYSYRENPSNEFGDPFCTLKDQQGQEYDFSYEEFRQLLAQIKDNVDYACFKKRHTIRDCDCVNPNDPIERR